MATKGIARESATVNSVASRAATSAGALLCLAERMAVEERGAARLIKAPAIQAACWQMTRVRCVRADDVAVTAIFHRC